MVDNIEEKVEKTIDTATEETGNEKKKQSSGEFMKKYGFYIGIGLIMLVTLIVIFSDKDKNYSGDVNYEKPIYYITANNLYIKERGKDEILISSTLFREPDSRSKEEALSAVLISQDGRYMYFYENITVETNGVMNGDFCVYHKGRKHLIQENTGIYFAVSEDASTVAYIRPNYGVAGGTGYDDVRFDLYTYSIKGGNKLIEKAVEPYWYNISGDGKSVLYTKFYDASTDSSSLFIYQNGKSRFIDDHTYFYGDVVPKGTFRQNWPKTNIDGSKVIYGKRMKYGEMASMYLHSNGTNTLLGDNALQLFTDDKLDQAVLVHNYDRDAFTGDMSRVDLNTLTVESITSDVWGLATVSVALTAESEFLDLNLYFKNYDSVINVADLCIMTENGEEVLIDATHVSNILFADDYSYIYGLEYFVPEEGGQVTKIAFDDKGYEKSQFGTFVKDFVISESGEYIIYREDDNIFLVGKKNDKIYIDKGGIETFGVLAGEEQMYFFRESSLGSGNAYTRGLGKSDNAQMVAEKSHYCWDFGDGSLAFLTDYDFATSTGSMYLTDDTGGYELIVENVELPLFFNYIQ